MLKYKGTTLHFQLRLPLLSAEQPDSYPTQIWVSTLAVYTHTHSTLSPLSGHLYQRSITAFLPMPHSRVGAPEEQLWFLSYNSCYKCKAYVWYLLGELIKKMNVESKHCRAYSYTQQNIATEGSKIEQNSSNWAPARREMNLWVARLS